jgi:hypothetical protein
MSATNGDAAGLPPLDTDHPLLDAWHEVLGELLAQHQRLWERERAKIEAEANAIIANLRAEIVTLTGKFERMITERLSALRDGEPGAPGPKGEPGPPGRDGRLRKVTQWSEGVHYEGDLVVCDGSMYQCVKDTGRPPLHEDWVCIAQAGRDGRTPVVRGTWSSSQTHEMLDIVALGGASFIARRDNPSACPGEDWQLLAMRGKKGDPGPRGEKGERGPAGPAGLLAPTIIGWQIDRESYSARPVMSDGSAGALLELRGLFEQYDHEVR